MAPRGPEVPHPQTLGGKKRSNRLLGDMDAPRDGSELVRGGNLVGGWILHPRRRIREVHVVVNGYLQLVVKDFHPRPDIADAFPHALDPNRLGWTATLALEGLVSDDAIVEAVAIWDVPGDPLRDRAARTMRRTFARATCRVSAPTDFAKAGHFLAPEELGSGFQRIYGVADAPGGISRVDVTVDGRSVGRARPMLPGTIDLAGNRPEGAVAVFEHVVELPPSGATRLGGTAYPLDGTPFELDERIVTVAGPDTARPLSKAVMAADERLVARMKRISGPDEADLPAVRPLFLTHDLGFGGGQLYLQELVRRLVRRGVGGAVVTLKGGRYLDELEDLGLPVLVVGPTGADDPECYEAQVMEIATYAKEHGCTVALGNTMLAYAGIDAAQRIGLPTVWAIHESFPLGQFWMEAYGNHIVSGHVDSLARRALRRCSEVVFEARATRDIYEPLLTPGASRVVPYGVDTTEIDDYRAANHRQQIRERLGFDESTLVYLCLGTIEPRKAQIPLVQAFSGSAELAGRDVALVLVGAREGSPYAEAARDLAAAHADDRVRIEPMQADTYQWYAAADLFVCASDVESLPRSILEAMAFGTPILSTRVYGVPDLITDGANGMLCETRDVRELRSMLERGAALSDEERAAMGAAARATVLQVHDPLIYEQHFLERLTALSTDRA